MAKNAEKYLAKTNHLMVDTTPIEKLDAALNKLKAWAKGKRVMETIETGDVKFPFKRQEKPQPPKEKKKKQH